MASIEIYTKTTCPYCRRAKALLKEKGASFHEIVIDGDSSLREEMIKRADGHMTVPQIFIDGHLIGGCDDLYQLDSDGKLDPLLAR